MYVLIDIHIIDSHISYIKNIKFKWMDLSKNDITGKELKQLLEELPIGSSHIDIYGNPIGDEGIILKLVELAITLNGNNDYEVLNSFFDTYSSIKTIKLDFTY